MGIRNHSLRNVCGVQALVGAKRSQVSNDLNPEFLETNLTLRYGNDHLRFNDRDWRKLSEQGRKVRDLIRKCL